MLKSKILKMPEQIKNAIEIEMDSNQTRKKIISAGRVAVDQLIRVAREEIISGGDNDLSADKLKNAAATKKLAIFDAFEIMERIDVEEDKLSESETSAGSPKKSEKQSSGGFAENNAK